MSGSLGAIPVKAITSARYDIDNVRTSATVRVRAAPLAPAQRHVYATIYKLPLGRGSGILSVDRARQRFICIAGLPSLL